MTENARSLSQVQFNLILGNQTFPVEFDVMVGSVAGLIWEQDNDVISEISAPVGRATTISARLTNMGNDIDNASTCLIYTSDAAND